MGGRGSGGGGGGGGGAKAPPPATYDNAIAHASLSDRYLACMCTAKDSNSLRAACCLHVNDAQTRLATLLVSRLS